MVRLRNIQRNDSLISCDYYPENTTEAPGHIVVNIQSETLESEQRAAYDADRKKSIYAHYAMLKLIDLKDSTTLPDKASYVWY